MEIHDRRISDFLLTQAWGGARAHKSPAKPQAFSPSCLSSTRFLSGSVYHGPGGWGGPRADHTLSCQRRRPWARGVTGWGPRPEAAALRAVPAAGLQCADSRANRRPRAVSLWPDLLTRLGPRVPRHCDYRRRHPARAGRLPTQRAWHLQGRRPGRPAASVEPQLCK